MSKRRNSRRVRAETKQAPITTMDAFSNPIARLGYGTQDLMQATQYPLTRMTQNYQLLTSLYRDNWIVQNIISTIPEDMVRKWYTLQSNVAPEYVDAMRRLERRTHLRKSILTGMYCGKTLIFPWHLMNALVSLPPVVLVKQPLAGF